MGITYKICNTCGTKNDSTESFCIECMSTDLFIFEDKGKEKAVKDENHYADKEVSSPVIKVCNSCGTKNKPDEPFCIECFGTDFKKNTDESLHISSDKDIVSCETETIIDSSIKVLKLLCNGIEKIIQPNEILGREGVCADLLYENKKISRKHAKFSFINNIWYIEDLNSTNGTYINNTKISPGDKIELKNGFNLKFSSTLNIKVFIEE